MNKIRTLWATLVCLLICWAWFLPSGEAACNSPGVADYELNVSASAPASPVYVPVETSVTFKATVEASVNAVNALTPTYQFEFAESNFPAWVANSQPYTTECSAPKSWSEPGHYQVTLTASNPPDDYSEDSFCEANTKWEVWVVKVDLQVAGLAEDDEETFGANVPYNNNDDNTSDTLDYSDAGVVGENDLQAVTAIVLPTNVPGVIAISGSDIFEDPLRMTNAAATYPPDAFPKTFYINGKAPGAPLNGAIAASHALSGAQDLIKLTTFMVDIKGPALFENTAMDDHIDEYSANSWGRYVELNDDDDAPSTGNNEWDFTDPVTDRAQDDRIVSLPLEVSPVMLAGNTIELTWNSALIKVYSGPDRASLSALASGVTYTGPASLPMLWIEGIQASSAMRDIEMTAKYTRNVGLPSIDKVKLTVCSVDIDGDSNTNGVIDGVGDTDDKLEGSDQYPVYVFLNDDDTDNDGTPDNANNTVQGTDDLAQMTDLIVRKVLPNDIPQGTVKLEGAANVRVFGQINGNWVEVKGPSGTGIDLWPYLPMNLKVEGVALGNEALTVRYKHGTTELTDKLYLKVFKVDLVIHKPKVIDTNEPEIPDADEISQGSMTFVNLDNDDSDTFFDYNPNGTSDAVVSGGDDELVKVVLKLQPNTLSGGNVKLEAISGANDVKAYKQNTKAFSSQYAWGDFLSVPGDFTIVGDSLVKEMWIEGISPQTSQQATKLKMTYDTGSTIGEDKAALTIVGIDEIEWKAQAGQMLDHNDPNWPNGLSPVGWRVFPGKYTPTGASHEKVDVDVKLSVAPPFPVKLYLDSIDVDDPSTNAAPVDDEAMPQDNRGNVAISSSGRFSGESVPGGIKEVIFLSGVSQNTVEFILTMQPGDNFRVVGSCDEDFLYHIENDDQALNVGATDVEKNENKQRIVNSDIAGTPAEKEIRDSDKYCSRTLTVWRKLWIERDSMDCIPESEKWIIGEVIQSTVVNATDSAGHQYSSLLGGILVPYSGSAPSQDEFEGGNLYFLISTAPGNYYEMGKDGGGPFRITRSGNLLSCQFTIYPALTSAQLSTIQGSAYKVYYKAQDDGDYSVFNSPVQLDIGTLSLAFAKAYIDAVYADDFNLLKIAPYKREITALDMASTLLVSRDLLSSPQMWTSHIVATFEPGPSLYFGLDIDFDGDGIVNFDLNGGVAPHDGAVPGHSLGLLGLYGMSTPVNSSAVFLEVIRDKNTSVLYWDAIKYDLPHISVHEIGHTAGLGMLHEDASYNLMHSNPDYFKDKSHFVPASIDHMRSVNEW